MKLGGWPVELVAFWPKDGGESGGRMRGGWLSLWGWTLKLERFDVYSGGRYVPYQKQVRRNDREPAQ